MYTTKKKMCFMGSVRRIGSIDKSLISLAEDQSSLPSTHNAAVHDCL